MRVKTQRQMPGGFVIGPFMAAALSIESLDRISEGTGLIEPMANRELKTLSDILGQTASLLVEPTGQQGVEGRQYPTSAQAGVNLIVQTALELLGAPNPSISVRFGVNVSVVATILPRLASAAKPKEEFLN